MSKILKKSARVLLGLLIGLVILGALYYSLWVYPNYSVPILTYHSFDHHHSELSVSPENFAKQMKFLKDRGYHVIPLDEAIVGMAQGRKFPHNTVVITIDDGYENNYTVAYPILKKYGFPATIFLVTDFIGTKRFFYDQNQSFLNWDEIRQMSKDNISFGAHTKNHVYLPFVKDKNILWDEIAGSKDAIEKHLRQPVDYFCYPYGGFTEEIKALVKKAGYKGAATTHRGFDLQNRKEFYEINRISVRNTNPYFSLSNLYKPMRFWIKLSGYYNLFRKGTKGC